MKKLCTVIIVFAMFIGFCHAQNINQNSNTVVIQNNPTSVVERIIEKPVYIEKYRTVYIDKPQPKRVAKKLSEPIQLLGYLWVYPEDIGNFKQHPVQVIEMINRQGLHGHANWRIPTPDELALLEANADRVGLGDDIYMATDYANGVLRLVAREDTPEEKAKRLGGVLIAGTIWRASNVGASDPGERGRLLTRDIAIKSCPEGWRLPTYNEFNTLLNSGQVGFRDHKTPNSSKKLFFSSTGSKGVYGGTIFYFEYWTSDVERGNNGDVLYVYINESGERKIIHPSWNEKKGVRCVFNK